MQKILTQDIIESLVFDLSTISFEEDFVAISVTLSKTGEASHCGLVVNYNKKPKLFHFLPGKVLQEELISSSKPLFLSILPIIKKEEVSAFLTKCEMICEQEQDLEWGFFYNGEFFDENNKLIFKIEENNITNCVFFCISVLSGFLVGEEYFEFSDWSEDGLAKKWFELFQRTLRKTPLTAEKIEAFSKTLKRIPPIDYFSSADITSLPIRKTDVDQYSVFMSEILKSKSENKKIA